MARPTGAELIATTPPWTTTAAGPGPLTVKLVMITGAGRDTSPMGRPSPPTLAAGRSALVPHVNYSSAVANIDASGEASSSDIQAVQRVGQICALFGPQVTELTAADVAERLGLNRTTAYRYCVSLAAAGILERGHRRGTFVLGGLMLQLGILALSRQRVVEIAPPRLAELSAAARTTAVLAIWGARGPVVALVQEDLSRTVVVTVHAGTQLDLDSAQIRVFLAYHSDEHAFERITEGVSDAKRAELEAGVYMARRNGYSLVSHTGGLFGAAAPVFDEYGICATIALLGADQMANLSPGSPTLTMLLDTAAALSDELGGGPERKRLADLR